MSSIESNPHLIMYVYNFIISDIQCHWFFFHRENNFTKVSKNLDTDLKIILLDYQKNYVECSNMMKL